MTGGRVFEERRAEALTDDAIILLGSSATVIGWTDAARRIYQFQAGEIIGRPYALLFSDDDAAIGAPTRELDVAGRSGRFAEQGRRVRRDGTHFLAEIVMTPWLDEAGQVAGYANLTRDVGERLTSEKALKKANVDLEVRVVERTAALRVAVDELEAFTYSVAHDLRAPLRSMQMFSEALVEDFGDQLDGKLRDYLGRIQRGSRRMSHLIDDLLRLAQVNRTPLDRQDICLSDLVTDILGELSRREPDRAVDTTVTPGIWSPGDRDLLRIALLNLLENAWKFTSKGPDSRVEFGLTRHKGAIVAFIRDNGVGFDMAYADKLFVPFQRLHSSHEFDGTGIGLVTAARIIRRHEGDVWLESRVDEGTTAYITLPELRQTQ